jgi:hypothetical protein
VNELKSCTALVTAAVILIVLRATGIIYISAYTFKYIQVVINLILVYLMLSAWVNTWKKINMKKEVLAEMEQVEKGLKEKGIKPPAKEGWPSKGVRKQLDRERLTLSLMFLSVIIFNLAIMTSIIKEII